MRADLLAVYVYRRLKVHGAEAQQHAASLHVLRNRERAPVPEDRMNRVRRADAAQLALIAEGNDDFPLKLCAGLLPARAHAFVGVVKRKRQTPFRFRKVSRMKSGLDARAGDIGVVL